ncbi:hypothetical protein E2C01_059282 [Portunus trituberculatus]|uniref:Secreted protein n=1 Tax=Portunus trituberculatus TaxID=210409 RepID=A0A5B7H4X8_PORTR|nr:hypothetical protein [Portunus trituberculatus]
MTKWCNSFYTAAFLLQCVYLPSTTTTTTTTHPHLVQTHHVFYVDSPALLRPTPCQSSHRPDTPSLGSSRVKNAGTQSYSTCSHARAGRANR